MNLPLGWNLEILSAPTVEPVTLAEVKAFARVAIDDDDDLIESLIPAARAICEQATRRVFLPTQFELTVSHLPFAPWAFPWGGWWGAGRDPSISLPRPPLVSLDSLSYADESGNPIALDLAKLRVVRGTPGRIAPAFGCFWPFSLPELGSIAIRYTAGYPDPAHVPATIKLAIKRLCTDWYDGLAEIGSAPDYIDAILAPAKYYGGIS